MAEATVHASAVLIGARAVLIRGPAGAGKSSLALRLVQGADTSLLPFVRLVADDRAHVEACYGRLLVRPAAKLAGLIEIRGLGIRRLPFEPVAVVGLIVDLATEAVDRLPQSEQQQAVIADVTLPRLAVAPGSDPLPRLLALAHTGAAA
jgi:HPr kinase/phosphorylase